MAFVSISIIGSIVLLVVSHIGSRKGLYGKEGENLWFGKVMHFSGGFFVAMFWAALTRYSLLIIALTLLVGTLWEIWEYLFGFYKLKKFGTRKYLTKTRDTIEDLIFDVIGACVFLLVLSFIF